MARAGPRLPPPWRRRRPRSCSERRSSAPAGDGAAAGVQRGNGRIAPRAPRREPCEPLPRQRDVDLVRQPLERRRPGADRPQGAPPPDRDRLHQELRRRRRLEPVHPRPRLQPQHRGLRVCAWQFVYGNHPGAEARRGAQAVEQGRRVPGDRRRVDLRGPLRGRRHVHRQAPPPDRREFPTALASFPYVDYHPGLPYSVFLGPGGARFNLPQVYWHAIGVSVGAAYKHTFIFNRVSGAHRAARPDL